MMIEMESQLMFSKTMGRLSILSLYLCNLISLFSPLCQNPAMLLKVLSFTLQYFVVESGSPSAPELLLDFGNSMPIH